MAAASLTAAVLSTTSASAAVRANKWTVVPAAGPTTGTALAAVTAVSATNLWAVGSVAPPGPAAHRPLIEHNTGSGWKMVAAPNVGTAGGELHGIAAVSAHDIWAVGSTGTNPLALHYDGTRWKAVPTAPPTPGEQPGGGFLAVAAVSATDVWAVGERPTVDGPGILVEHWDGHRWTFIVAPSEAPTDFNALSGLAVVSARDIWAVGSRGDDFNEPLVEHWNGTVWSVVDVPEPPQVNPDDPKDVGLTAVTALSATNVWAVGQAGLIEHYDGHAWRIVPAPRPAGDTDGMSTRWAAVSARSARDVWAVGGVGGTPVSLHWNGTAWSLVPVPASGAGLDGVVATATAGTTAVGVRSIGTEQRALIVHNGR
ncbi:MAG: hypothetical protein AUG44_03695 [Actinobacteria bacterium 13_1_20CM_3_71_11]|nr:MAG: hypothetical protein AUG44_03695 [Actinobacteria bacterium 13_1_20CM_3_71_11]